MKGKIYQLLIIEKTKMKMGDWMKQKRVDWFVESVGYAIRLLFKELLIYFGKKYYFIFNG